MSSCDGLHFPIGETQFLLQVAIDHRLAQVELHLLLDSLSELWHLNRGLRSSQVAIDEFSHPAVQLLILWPPFGSSFSVGLLLLEQFQLPRDI